MTLDNRPVLKGGCQCGAVRFTLEGAPGDASICHCRMCQKAFGNVFAPLVSVGSARLTWTGAEPSRFQSSNHVMRGFCPRCGTPLTYEAPDGVALAIGKHLDFHMAWVLQELLHVDRGIVEGCAGLGGLLGLEILVAAPAADGSHDQHHQGDEIDRILVPQLLELFATYFLVDFVK